MNLIRRTPAYPKDRDLSRVVQAAAARLAGKIEGLDPHSLDLSPEGCLLICQRRECVKEEIERCAQVFAWALPRDEKPFSDLSLVAFADRLGLFALLARECNVGTVVCHNTEGADVDDARIVAKALRSPADHYVFGDLEDLEFVLGHRGISCDVFVSRAGLDELAGARAFFGAVTGLSNGAMSFGIAVGREPRSRSGRHTGRRPIDNLRNELSQAGFEMTIVPATSMRRLIRSGSRLGGLISRSIGLSSGSAYGLAASDFPTAILCGRRRGAKLPVEDGVPYLRGRERSGEPEEILSR